MTTASADLKRLIRQEIDRSQSTFRIMKVSALQDDGTVNLSYGGVVLADIPAAAGYRPRTVGDIVLVLHHPGGWRVLDKVGAAVEAEVHWDDIEDRPTIPDPVDISWGKAGPSGSGWMKADSIYVRENQIYARFLPADPDPPTPPAPKPKPDNRPKTVTISVDSDYAYRSGKKYPRDAPVQGAWSGADYSGAWFYGNSIANACAGRTVTKMQIKMTRAKSGGWYRGVSAHLYRHNNTTAPTGTPTLTDRWTPGKLEPGEGAWFTLPSDWRSALASGASKGVGCDGTGRNDYIVFGTCGTIKITFA